MLTIIKCEHCHKTFKVDDPLHEGDVMGCPSCGRTSVIERFIPCQFAETRRGDEPPTTGCRSSSSVGERR